jgi:hypothetical protein
MKQPKLIVIHKFLNPNDAHIAKNLLENAGIKAYLLDEHSSYSIGTPIVLGGYRLAIADIDLVDSSKILEDFVHLNSIIEPAEKTICPRCSSTLISNRNLSTFLSILLFLLSSIIISSLKSNSYYRYKRCRYKWNKNRRA